MANSWFRPQGSKRLGMRRMSQPAFMRWRYGDREADLGRGMERCEPSVFTCTGTADFRGISGT